jgi:hypothetical protein
LLSIALQALLAVWMLVAFSFVALLLYIGFTLSASAALTSSATQGRCDTERIPANHQRFPDPVANEFCRTATRPNKTRPLESFVVWHESLI